MNRSGQGNVATEDQSSADRTNEQRMVDALESMAESLFFIREHLHDLALCVDDFEGRRDAALRIDDSSARRGARAE